MEGISHLKNLKDLVTYLSPPKSVPSENCNSYGFFLKNLHQAGPILGLCWVRVSLEIVKNDAYLRAATQQNALF